MAEKTELLNGLDSADFTPNLATLDTLVASLEIDSVPVSGLQDKTWQWISGPAQPGSSEVITIEHPELYQVTYTSDGTVEIVADCNRASLSYELKQGGLVGGMLAAPGPMTLAECGPESHYRGFVSSLQAAQTYRVHPGGNELSLILPAGGGVLVLRAAGQTESAMSLEGTPWRLVSYHDGESALASALSGTEITATFADGKLTGSAGCNSYSASYEREDDTLTLGPVATTRKMCAEPEGIMEQERDYLTALASVAEYRVQGGRIELLDAEGKAVATFETMEETAASEIFGVTWQWQSTQTPVEKVTVDTPERYTLKLGPDGQVDVLADCNRLGGTYTLTDTHITVALTTSTMAACPPDSLADRFIKELNASAIYFTEGEELLVDLQYDSGTMRFARRE
jgi:heat shock protein HslJ